jgi:hypothetical protein
MSAKIPDRAVSICITALIVLLISGCAATHGIVVRPDQDKRVEIHFSEENNWSEEKLCNALRYHIVEVGQSGKYRPIRTNLFCGGSDSGDLYSQPERFETHIEHIRRHITQDYREVVFIIHGGLVSRTKGLREALVLNRAISLDEEQSGENKRYPIFINWRSGGADAYAEQLFQIRKGERMKRLATLSSPIKLFSDMGRGIADTPSSGALEADRLIRTFGDKINECDSTSYSSAAVLCPEDPVGNTSSLPKTMGYVVMTPIRILTAPFINGPGRPAWENMVRRTRNAFWREPKDNEPARRGAVRELFDRLFMGGNEKAATIQMPMEQSACGFDGRKITIIGHSMGTMIISDLLNAYPQCPYKNIVFMGAAVSIREFQDTVPPVLLRKGNTHFYNLSLLPKAEARETSGIVGTLPSGSLLEWIDEMYTPPTTKFDRTLGKWVNAREVLPSFPVYLRGKMTFKVFGMAQGEPTVHGAFNDVDMCFWRESFWSSPWTQHHEDCRRFLERESILEVR